MNTTPSHVGFWIQLMHDLSISKVKRVKEGRIVLRMITAHRFQGWMMIYTDGEMVERQSLRKSIRLLPGGDESSVYPPPPPPEDRLLALGFHVITAPSGQDHLISGIRHSLRQNSPVSPYSQNTGHQIHESKRHREKNKQTRISCQGATLPAYDYLFWHSLNLSLPGYEPDRNLTRSWLAASGAGQRLWMWMDVFQLSKFKYTDKAIVNRQLEIKKTTF